MAVTINASTSAGLVQTADTSGVLALQTAGTTAVTVDASQNVGIGTASPAARLSIVAGTMQSQLLLGVNTSNANYGSISLNGINADSTRLGFTGGGTGDNTLYIDVPTSGQCAFRTGGTQAMILNASNNLQTIGTISVGNATPSTSGAGITFPATQSASSNANTLDDYEEGTWTPAGNGVTYTSPVGNYTKIGDFVFCTYQFAFPSTASTSSAEIQGLPFAVSSSSGARGTFSVAGVDTAISPIYGALTGSKVILRDTSNNDRTNVAFTTATLNGMIIYRV